MKSVLLVSTLLWLCCACDSPLAFSPVSQAPPTKEAALHSMGGITISKDVALALECWSGSGPCAKMRFEVGDPSLVQIFRAFENQTMTTQGEDQPPIEEKASVFVVVGTNVGKTNIHVVAENGDADLAVDVVEP
jgi:hypothetical protein